ncbi:kinesin-like protein KIN-7O [Impatiens glandulifera]|uniref:kinesin-like protein KIN-7O n=1 Tax=Impatiens glandulifera TaxID=253017 RepID=UPI001FB06880|nr:kinesin-like protein KIN-7O [Impatiens glandulifera]
MERIHVTLRARPLSEEEAKNSPWRINGNTISNHSHSSKFEFDSIFGEDCKTKDIYETRINDIVGAAVRGFNGTVFAYGQTSSGKTYTMQGTDSEPGVIPLAIRNVFDIIQEDMDREFLLRMSYMEIYNEEINDLLAPEHQKLQVHESIERGIFVAGLREEIVASPHQVLELMEFGVSHRHIGETNMNLYSSRSHTIFRMIIESRERNEHENIGSSCDAVRVSVLNLVDLAGSERVVKTGAEGVRLKEGSHINKSLLTLGTVIKKLSEGVESQGGHVPYRDSKLTRILQPALGGNANTAIICNITLAQIHADETKSSLLFASRALQVTNCARVNEILTDAALLKRQKKEIEELKAKLQGSHSEYFEGEILNLRNTLLQTELERERIALELEEEKKAQAEKEMRLKEQAKKIESLSTMVLNSNRDEIHNRPKKDKRRDTWCFGNLSNQAISEAHSRPSVVRSMKSVHGTGPLLPFDELVNEDAYNLSKSEKVNNMGKIESITLPDPSALLNITSRKKLPPKKKSSPPENKDLEEMRVEYEDLLLKFETQTIISDIQIDYLTRKRAEADSCVVEKPSITATCNLNSSIVHGETASSCREPEAILVIKQLQEKINMLEMDKLSAVELAKERHISALENYNMLYEELLNAQEDARVAHEKLTYVDSRNTVDEASIDFMAKLLAEVKEIALELQGSRDLFETVDELFQDVSSISKPLNNIKSLACQNILQLKSNFQDQEKLHSCMKNIITQLMKEKLELQNQNMELQTHIQELSKKVEDSALTFDELSEQHNLELSELVSQIQYMEMKGSDISYCTMAKEKENVRKDLEKTKSKLRETESKLKNIIQEKTKLEGEKACADKELKQLHGQKALLQRDINKYESVAGRRHDSVADRTSNSFDLKKMKCAGPPIHLEQDYKQLEVVVFEMEATICSLEDELAAVHEEKKAIVSSNDGLIEDLHSLSEEFNMSNMQLNMLKEEASNLKFSLEDLKSCNQKQESSIKLLSEEKEELAMQLTEALLAMEEEKAIWSFKEKASMEVIEEKAKKHIAEIAILSEETSKAIAVKHIENTKLRMRLEGCQAKLDCYDVRYKESIKEMDLMNSKFMEASAKLKSQLAFYGHEVLNLKRQLAETKMR